MLREKHVATASPGQQRNRFFRFRNFRREVTEELGFDVLENAMNYAEAIGVRRGFAHGLHGFDFREALKERPRSLEIRVSLGERAFRRCNQILRCATKLFRGCAKTEKILPRSSLGPSAANKLDAPILPHFRAAPHQKHSDLPGAFNVRAAARLEVGTFDLDGPQNPGAVHFFANTKLGQIFRRAIPNGHGAVFENNLVGSALRALQDFASRLWPSQINCAQVRSEMKRERRPAKALLKHCREQMLACVLLHVVETARPVDAAEGVRASRAPVNDVHDFVAIVAHVKHVCVANFAQIVRLAPGGGIKSGAIQKQT